MLTDTHEDLIREVRKNADYKGRIEKLEKLLLSDAEREALLQLFISGPTWDGDVISKQERTKIMTRGLAWRIEGWTYLTELGVTYALALQMDREKERRTRTDGCAMAQAPQLEQ